MIPLDWNVYGWEKPTGKALEVIPAVYIISYEKWIPLYVGSTTLLQWRIISHEVIKKKIGTRIGIYIHWIPCSLYVMQQIEQDIIDTLNPIFNAGRAGSREKDQWWHELELERKELFCRFRTRQEQLEQSNVRPRRKQG